MDANAQFYSRRKSSTSQDIQRVHNSFGRGMFAESPPSDIPSQGEQDIYNMKVMGSYLESRPGTMEWGRYELDTPVPAVAVPYTVGPYSATMHSGHVSPGQDPLDKSVNMFTVVDYNFQEWIWPGTSSDHTGLDLMASGWLITYNHPTTGVTHTEEIFKVQGGGGTAIEFFTHSTSEFPSPDVSGNVTIQPRINSHLFVESAKKFVIDCGGSLYISTDMYCGAWERFTFIGGAPFRSRIGFPNIDAPVHSSSLIEYYGTVIWATDSGIFRVSMSTKETWRVNTATPTIRLGDIGAKATDVLLPANGTDAFLRKMTYTLSKLSGEGVRDRLGSNIQWESGNVKEYPERGYSALWCVDHDAVSVPANSPNISGFSLAHVTEEHDSIQASHFSIYATKNATTTAQTELGNGPETYIWLADLPVAWFAIATAVSSSLVTLSTIPPKGFSEMVINQLANPAKLETTPNASNQYTVFMDTIVPEVNDILSYGLTTFSIISAINTSLRLITTDVVHGGDIGERVYFSNGTFTYITRKISTTQFEVARIPTGVVAWSVRVGTGVVPPRTGSGQLGGTGPTYTYGYKITQSDQLLGDRATLMGMSSRFMEPMQDADLCAIQGLFFLSGMVDAEVVEYSQLVENEEYLLGQTHRAYQYHPLDDPLQALIRFKSSIAGLCTNSTVSIGTASFDDLKESVEPLYITPSPRNLSENIGIIHRRCVAPDAEGSYYLYTTEGHLRLFNGISFSSDISLGRISDTLKSRIDSVTLSYIRGQGLFVSTLIGVDNES